MDTTKCSEATSHPQLSLEDWIEVGVQEAGIENEWPSEEDLWSSEWQSLDVLMDGTLAEEEEDETETET